MIRKSINIAFLLCLQFFYLVPGVIGADFQKGVDAYNRGEFTIALKEWVQLAEQGKVEAQYNLGWMYYKGQGASSNYKLAYIWSSIAAISGHGKNADENRVTFAEKLSAKVLADADRIVNEKHAKIEARKQ